MKIRTQAVLAIVPLFIGLAGVNLALSYGSARQEASWGVREEATSLAVAIAEFLDGDALANDGAAYLERARPTIESLIARRGQAHRVVVLASDGATVLAVHPAGAPGAAGLPDGAALRPLLLEDSVYFRARWTAGDTVFATAAAPILRTDGTLAGGLAVVTNRGSFDALTRAALGRTAQLALIAVLLGVAVAVGMSGVLSRRLRELNETVRRAAGGRYDKVAPAGSLQEMNDLANTFNTMSSVLSDFLQKTRKALIEGEQFRSSAVLAETMREQITQPWREQLGAIRLCAQPVTRGHPADIGTLMRDGTDAIVIVARLSETPDLDAALAADAARAYLSAAIQRNALDDALLDAAATFGAVRLKAARIGDDGRVSTAFVKDGTVDWADADLQTGPIVLHTLDDQAGRLVGSYKRLFRDLPPADMAGELAGALDGRARGIIIVIGLELDGGTPASQTGSTNA